jgi:hypothetical protein
VTFLDGLATDPADLERHGACARGVRRVLDLERDLDEQPLGRHAARDQRVSHRLGPCAGQGLARALGGCGVAEDRGELDLRVREEGCGERVEQRGALAREARAASRELDPLEDAQLCLLDAHEPTAVGAAVVVARAVVVLGLARTAITRVGDAVAVVVRVGAAVGVLEAIEVLGETGAEIVDVGDPVRVVVGIGAPVEIRHLVEILGRVRARVARQKDAVAIAVELGGLGHPRRTAGCEHERRSRREAARAQGPRNNRLET